MSPITAKRLEKFVLSKKNSSQHAKRSTSRIAQLSLKRTEVKVFQNYEILYLCVGNIYLMCNMVLETWIQCLRWTKNKFNAI